MEQNLKVRSGNKIVVVIDRRPIGMVQQVTANDSYNPEPTLGIGDIHVQEYVPTTALHSLSISQMVLIKGAMLEAGIMAENADAVLDGLLFDLEWYDKDTGNLLRKYVGVSYASGRIEVGAHKIVIASGEFNALDVFGKAM